MDSIFTLFSQLAVDIGFSNFTEKIVGSHLFKTGFLKLLPEKFDASTKEDIYQELIKKEYIISEKNITVIKYSGDIFDYKKEKEFFHYLNTKFEEDKVTIEKIKNYYYYNNNKYILKKKNKKNTKRKTINRKLTKI